MEPTVCLSDDSSVRPLEPTRRRLLLRVLLAVMVAVAAVTASWWPFWWSETSTGVVNLLVAVTLAATAAVLHEDPEQRSTALAIALAATFYLTSWWWAWPPQWQVGPLPLLSFVLGYLWFMFGGLALTRYPEPRLARRYERILFGALTVWICGLKLVIVATSQAQWAGFGDRAWWIGIVPDRGAFDTLTAVFNAGLVVFIFGLLAVLLLKIGRVRGLERSDSAPAVVAAAAVAICGLLYLGARILGLSDEVQDQLRIVTAVAAMAAPAAFLTAGIRRQVISSTAVESLPRIYYAAEPGDVRDEVRSALRDPGLQLWSWHPALGYIDLTGSPADPVAEAGRWLVTIRSSDNLELAVMAMKLSLRHHRKLIDSAAHAVGVALERQARYEDLRASRVRINEAELTARHTIARDLHDGAQQVLLTARLRLAMATRRAAADNGTREAIDQAREDIDSALRVIRDLAAGNDPSLLHEGLAAAVPEIVRDLGIPVELRISVEHLDPSIERNLWFLVSEGITNMRKHARASSAAVTIERDGDDVIVQIVDNGCGGAHPAHGSGLAGMVDRVHVLRGQIRIDSPVDHGTTIEARLPCV